MNVFKSFLISAAVISAVALTGCTTNTPYNGGRSVNRYYGRSVNRYDENDGRAITPRDGRTVVPRDGFDGRAASRYEHDRSVSSKP